MAGRLCVKGCGRPAYGSFDTCCVKCAQNDGHNFDCAKKVQPGRKRKADDISGDEALARRLQQEEAALVQQAPPLHAAVALQSHATVVRVLLQPGRVPLPKAGEPDVYCTTRSNFDPNEWEVGDPRFDKRAKWILNIPLARASERLFVNLVAAQRAGELASPVIKARNCGPSRPVALLMVYVDDFRDERAVRRVAEQMAAAGGVLDNDSVSCKPEKFGQEGRRGGQSAARLGLESESTAPTGVWRFKARGMALQAFDRVEPSLKSGPAFWEDQGGDQLLQPADPSARVVKPGAPYSK